MIEKPTAYRTQANTWYNAINSSHVNIDDTPPFFIESALLFRFNSFIKKNTFVRTVCVETNILSTIRGLPAHNEPSL